MIKGSSFEKDPIYFSYYSTINIYCIQLLELFKASKGWDLQK